MSTTHYQDQLRRILGVCQACGILSHDETIRRNDGKVDTYRVEDVRSTGKVLLTASYVKYPLVVNPRILTRIRGMASQFAYVLGVTGVSVEVDEDTVFVRVPREKRDTGLSFDAAWAMKPDMPRGTLLLGVDEAGEQLCLNMLSPSVVHASVTGTTGSGKSTLMRAMALSAEMSGQPVALFDVSHGGLWPLSGHPFVWRGGLFCKADNCVAGLRYLAESITTENRTDIPRPLVVFVDETPELVRQAPEAKQYIAAIAGVGRNANMHLILGAQHPLAEDLGSATMRNIPTRITGKVLDRTAAYVVTGHRDSGAETLRGNGDMIIYVGGERTHFQGAMVEQSTLSDWMRRYAPRLADVPRVETQNDITHHGIMSSERPAMGKRGGSEVDPIPPVILSKIRRYYGDHHMAPSGQWVRRLSKASGATGHTEFGNLKAQRAIYEALLAAGIRYDGYDPACQETASAVISGTVSAGVSGVD